MYRCLICNAPVEDYEPIGCCSGRDCGCLGQPTNPCVCSDECANAVFGFSGTYEQRRWAAGIEEYVEPQELTKLRIYAPRGGPYFVTHVWGPMQLETMKIFDDALNCEDYDYKFWFGDLPKGVQDVECELRWDVYDDGVFPMLENVKVVEMLTPEQMESEEKDLRSRDQAELYDIPF